jgi:hypothetical protein
VPDAAAYTAVLCRAPRCGAGDPGTVWSRSAAALRAAVATSRQGVLVSAGCLVGPAACGLRPSAPLVVVQPCDTDRNPTGPALRIGPLRTEADVDALAAWLRAGDLDGALRPAHLLDLHRRAAAAPRN